MASVNTKSTPWPHRGHAPHQSKWNPEALPSGTEPAELPKELPSVSVAEKPEKKVKEKLRDKMKEVGRKFKNRSKSSEHPREEDEKRREREQKQSSLGTSLASSQVSSGDHSDGEDSEGTIEPLNKGHTSLLLRSAMINWRGQDDEDGATGTQRQRKYKRYDPRNLRPGLRTGSPPAGYCYIWVGNFRRWQRRFMVIYTPGLMLYYKRSNRKGQVWSIDLKEASVVVTETHRRQFIVVSGSVLYYIRTLHQDYREAWVATIQNSIDKYQAAVTKATSFQKLKQVQADGTPLSPVSTERQLEDRVTRAEATLQREQQAVMAELARVQQGLAALAGALQLSMPPPPQLLPPSPPTAGPATGSGGCVEVVPPPPKAGRRSSEDSEGWRRSEHATPSPFAGAGALAATWEQLQVATRDALRAEIQHSMDLERENVELSERLRHVEAASMSKRSLRSINLSCQVGDEEGYSSDSAQSTDSDESVMPLPSQLSRSDGGMEDEFFEALEVLNQHESLSQYFMQNSESFMSADGGANATEPGGVLLLRKASSQADDPSDEDESSEASDEDDEDDFLPRTSLPVPSPIHMGFNVWSLIKSAIGKDLASITLPIVVNEPMSGLQRGVEEIEYCHIIEEALGKSSSLARLLHMCMFVISPYSGAQRRSHKPLTPYLGETFEWTNEGHYRIVLEQVCQHPPISAWHAESLVEDLPYTMYGEVQFSNAFWGKTADLIPIGSVHLDAPGTGDHFSWNKVRLSVHNLISGTLWCNIHGEITVHNHTTHEYAKIKLVPGKSKDTCGNVEGTVFDADKKPVYTFSGNHMEGIDARLCPDAAQRRAAPAPEPSRVYTPKPMPPNHHRQYYFGDLTIALNELTSTHLDTLPCTDSRMRPDLRAIEEGNSTTATEEKLRIEAKQRMARQQRKERHEEYRPLWFTTTSPKPTTVNPYSRKDTLDTAWRSNGKYWVHRQLNDWDMCPDIF